MVEIRASDLRFSAEEASTYLNEVMGLGLGSEDVAALEERTEGWIAALQLAALSMEGRDDIAGVRRPVYGHRPIHSRLPGRGGPAAPPADIRTFLLDTCILDRMSGLAL